MSRRWAMLAMLLPALLPGQQPVVRGWRVAPDVALRIWLPTGAVRIEAWDRDSIDVRGTHGKGASFFGGIATGGGAAKFGVEPLRRDDPALPAGELRVMVPRRAQVTCKVTEGSVEGSGLAGSLEVLSVAGQVIVRDSRGIVTVETIDAAVRLERVSGAMRVRGGSGAVTLTAVDGTLSLATVGGAIELATGTIGDGRIETIGGPIRVRGALRPGARLEVQSHDGPITLALDRASLPRLDLASRGGGVDNPLGLGAARFGEVIARSFKGRINVVAVGGIERGKRNLP